MKPDMQERVREVHPELSFWALNGGVATLHNKKTRGGYEERWRLLRELPLMLGKAPPALPESMRGRCGTDDRVDALVCAWTAACVVRGEARRIPAQVEFDEHGRRMEIWYPSGK